jgi:hypothetical protein
VAARVVTWWHLGVCSPLASPLIFIEHANGLLHRRPISTSLNENCYDCLFGTSPIDVTQNKTADGVGKAIDALTHSLMVDTGARQAIE